MNNQQPTAGTFRGYNFQVFETRDGDEFIITYQNRKVYQAKTNRYQGANQALFIIGGLAPGRRGGPGKRAA